MKKRIFIINDIAAGGGAEIVMRDLINYLRDKYDITLMTLDDDSEGAKKLFGDKVRYLPSKIKANPYSRNNPLYFLTALYNKLRIAAIRKKRFDVAIANKEGPCMKIVSKMAAKKKIGWVHADYNLVYWTHFTYKEGEELQCMKEYDSIVCVSKAAEDGVRAVIGDPGNLCVRYNPIDFTKILERSKLGEGVEKDSSKPLFVAVGRLDPQKNFVTLARVAARLCREFDFEVWIVGEGSDRDAIEKVLKDEGCTSLKLLGMQENPYKYVAKADMLISTSLGESYGLVIQEALILGVPVLSTRCPAIEECLDTRFGLLVDCTEEEIERGMRKILEDPAVIKEYKRNIEAGYERDTLWEKRLSDIEGLIK